MQINKWRTDAENIWGEIKIKDGTKIIIIDMLWRSSCSRTDTQDPGSQGCNYRYKVQMVKNFARNWLKISRENEKNF